MLSESVICGISEFFRVLEFAARKYLVATSRSAIATHLTFRWRWQEAKVLENVHHAHQECKQAIKQQQTLEQRNKFRRNAYNGDCEEKCFRFSINKLKASSKIKGKIKIKSRKKEQIIILQLFQWLRSWESSKLTHTHTRTYTNTHMCVADGEKSKLNNIINNLYINF